ncbi:hypothetical protein KAJ87_00635 [Candidatus Pacearchaeota archaeon]|nr:hypothetical protein [Candidatus Pacearchaeota archaeon]
MGWKGVIQELERSSKRAQKQRERQFKYEQKMTQIEDCKKEVSCYENHLNSLISFHLEEVNFFDWKKKLSDKKPNEPTKKNIHESEAIKEQKLYAPSFFDKTFSRIEKKKKKLSYNVDLAKTKDDLEYKQSKKDFLKEYTDWKKFNSLAKGVLAGNLKFYIEAIEEIKPFSNVKFSCEDIAVSMKNKKIAILNVKIPSDEEVIPKEIKSFLKSGKVSIKPMPKIRYNELFQDYVCSVSIFLAKRLFSILPLEIVIVNVLKDVLNSQTGHFEKSPVLSVAISNKTLEKINLKNIDPSDCINNFVHNMQFKKSSGFEPVKLLDPSKFK